MVLAGHAWNEKLGTEERLYLLQQAYPTRSKTLCEYEAKLDWDSLLPSTQKDLLKLDWEMALDRIDLEPW